MPQFVFTKKEPFEKDVKQFFKGHHVYVDILSEEDNFAGSILKALKLAGDKNASSSTQATTPSNVSSEVVIPNKKEPAKETLKNFANLKNSADCVIGNFKENSTSVSNAEVQKFSLPQKQVVLESKQEFSKIPALKSSEATKPVSIGSKYENSKQSSMVNANIKKEDLDQQDNKNNVADKINSFSSKISPSNSTHTKRITHAAKSSSFSKDNLSSNKFLAGQDLTEKESAQDFRMKELESLRNTGIANNVKNKFNSKPLIADTSKPLTSETLFERETKGTKIPSQDVQKEIPKLGSSWTRQSVDEEETKTNEKDKAIPTKKTYVVNALPQNIQFSTKSNAAMKPSTFNKTLPSKVTSTSEKVQPSLNANNYKSITVSSDTKPMRPASAFYILGTPEEVYSQSNINKSSAIARYDFFAKEQKELPIKKGDCAEIMQLDEDWCIAKNEEGQVGLVPLNFFDISESKTPQVQKTNVVLDFTKTDMGKKIEPKFTKKPDQSDKYESDGNGVPMISISQPSTKIQPLPKFSISVKESEKSQTQPSTKIQNLPISIKESEKSQYQQSSKIEPLPKLHTSVKDLGKSPIQLSSKMEPIKLPIPVKEPEKSPNQPSTKMEQLPKLPITVKEPDQPISVNKNLSKQQTTPPRDVYVGIYDFNATASDELTFKVDDIFYLVEKTEPDWWLMVNEKGQEGVVPSNYVEIKYSIPLNDIKNFAEEKTAEKTQLIVCTANFEARLADELNCEKGELLTLIHYEEEWSTARNSKNKEGVVPTDYTVPINDDNIISGSLEGKYICLYDFEKQQDGDMNAKTGELLIMVEEESDEWMLMKNSNGDTGYIPSSYLTKIIK